MSTTNLYKPKYCAFHPKELIFNFCCNEECLLPLCPSCVKIHSEEHRAEQTYGQFENITKVVGDLNTFFGKTLRDLTHCTQDIQEQQGLKKKEQDDLKRRIGDAKTKMIGLVERFFTDFQKEVSKSVLSYNESMAQSYGKVQTHIEDLSAQLKEKGANLEGEKVLKTLIGFHARGEEQTYEEQVESIRTRISYLDTQKVEVVCQPAATQKVIDELGNYIHLAFQNWQNEIKYAAQFVKTGLASTGSDGFHTNATANLKARAQQMRT